MSMPCLIAGIEFFRPTKLYTSDKEDIEIEIVYTSDQKIEIEIVYTSDQKYWNWNSLHFWWTQNEIEIVYTSDKNNVEIEIAYTTDKKTTWNQNSLHSW